MLKLGLYEQLINKLIHSKLKEIDKDRFYVKETALDKEEAAEYLSKYLGEIIKVALGSLSNGEHTEKQIDLSNKIISLLNQELKTTLFNEDILDVQGKILTAVISRLNNDFVDIDNRLKQITPYTRFTQSELFTGGATNLKVTLESELKKEILSANHVCFLVSFIKFAGIRIFKKELEEFTNNGGKLQVITTSYMGITDVKAIEFLSGLKNTEIKVSYNVLSERLHAKAYLFLRDTGFHTGYIGSSNLSKSAVTNGMEWNIKITTKKSAI